MLSCGLETTGSLFFDLEPSPIPAQLFHNLLLRIGLVRQVVRKFFKLNDCTHLHFLSV